LISRTRCPPTRRPARSTRSSRWRLPAWWRGLPQSSRLPTTTTEDLQTTTTDRPTDTAGPTGRRLSPERVTAGRTTAVNIRNCSQEMLFCDRVKNNYVVLWSFQQQFSVRHSRVKKKLRTILFNADFDLEFGFYLTATFSSSWANSSRIVFYLFLKRHKQKEYNIWQGMEIELKWFVAILKISNSKSQKKLKFSQKQKLKVTFHTQMISRWFCLLKKNNFWCKLTS
jgi:hypothetical protein